MGNVPRRRRNKFGYVKVGEAQIRIRRNERHARISDFLNQSRLFFAGMAQLGGAEGAPTKITRNQYDTFVKTMEKKIKAGSGGLGVSKHMVDAIGMIFSLLDLDGNAELTYHECVA